MRVTNIIKNNSDKIKILEDTVAFNKLIKPKIIKKLKEDFKSTISDIYYYMKDKIHQSIDISFSEYKILKNKVIELFDNYILKQKNKVENLRNI